MMENGMKRSGEFGSMPESPVLVYLDGLPRGGRPAIRGSLDTVAQRLGYDNARTAPWNTLRAENVAALRAWLSEAFKPARANRYLSAVKGTMKVAWQLGQINGRAIVDILGIKGVRRSSRQSGRSLSAAEIRAIVEACADGTSKGTRDLAIVVLAYCGGLRRSEIAALNLEDVKAEAEAFAVQVLGEVRQERTVVIDNGGALAIRDYLTVRGGETGSLFHKCGEGGDVAAGERLTADGLFGVLRERAEKAGVEGVSPHDMRRTFVRGVLAASVDVLTVSALTGRDCPRATARDNLGGDEAALKVVKNLQLPQGPNAGGRSPAFRAFL
jgi:integrase/recombinase XerD